MLAGWHEKPNLCIPHQPVRLRICLPAVKCPYTCPSGHSLVVNNESGLVTKTKDVTALSEAILKVYNNPELCKAFGKNAKKRIATHLNAEQTAQKTKQLYEELVAEKK